MSREKSHYYVDNKKFYEAILDHQKSMRRAKRNKTPMPKVPDYIGDCIAKIANHLSYSPNFINYTFREEMIGDAIENCLMYFDNFDPKKSTNPFAYFTQISWYAFIRRIGREQKQQYVKYKMAATYAHLFPKMYLDGEGKQIRQDNQSYEYDENYEENSLQSLLVYDNIQDFIENFEEKQRQKKKKLRRAKDNTRI